MLVVRYILVFLSVLLFVGCTAFEEESLDETPEFEEEQEQLLWDAPQYYEAAKKSFDSGDYEKSLEYYRAILGLFPGTTYAKQAMLDMTYVNYTNREWDEVRSVARQFEDLFPDQPEKAYILYLSTMSLYEKFKTFFDDLLDLEHSGRDRSLLLEIYFDFKKITDQFPNTQYAQEARRQMVEIHDALAGHEMDVALFYLAKGVYLPVVIRTQYLIENFPNSDDVADALFLRAYAYNRLGVSDLSDDSEAVLRLNYPDYVPNEDVKVLVEDDMDLWQETDPQNPLIFDEGMMTFLQKSESELERVPQSSEPKVDEPSVIDLEAPNLDQLPF